MEHIDKSQFIRERYGERMRILYELSWLWETLVIALAAAAVCVVCAMLICKAVKKNLSNISLVGAKSANTIRIGTCQSGYLKSLVECGNADNRLVNHIRNMV